ncbi:MAG: type secretion system family protein [Ramlibacter sp.]|jgi:general secretion pathway protein F/type IV pilus assembly protein PilC|nr:type secretion system family protein [Ramlibacter sp.]
MDASRIFWFRFLLPTGSVRQRVALLQASDPCTARLLIERQTGAVVMGLWQAPALLAAWWRFLMPLLRGRWPSDQLAEFFHNLGVMLKSGLPVDTALKDLAHDIEHPGIRRFAHEMHLSVAAGNALSVSLAQYEHQIPVAVRALVGIGEQSGDLDRTLIESGQHIKRMQRIRQDIGKALIYPLFALGTIAAAVIFWIYYVLPELARMFQQMGAKLPSYTVAAIRLIRAMQDFMHTGFWFAAALTVVALALLLRSDAVRFRIFQLLYRLPISGLLIKSSALAFITEYLALLIRAGLPLTESLKILTANVKNPFYARKLEQIRDGVNRGNGLSVEMNRSGVFPAMVVRLVSVGEQTGTLDSQLQILADDYRQRLEHVIGSLSEILKPVLIIVAGAFFVLVVVVFLLPVYQLISQVMKK